MAERIRTGVVGLGYFGNFHARHYAAHPDAILVGVADPRPERAEVAAGHGSAFFADYRELIGQVDAVSIAVPTSLHHAVAGAFIDAGVAVLVEKPVTDDVATAGDLVERAANKGVVFNVGHIERFSPAFRTLAAEIPAPRLIECQRHNPWSGRAIDVDVVLDLMIHDIDLALALAQSEVLGVEATGVAVAGTGADAVNARLLFASGAVAELSASRVAPAAQRAVRALAPGLAVTADLVGRTVTVLRGAPGATPVSESPAVVPQDALGAEIAAFLEAVQGRPNPGVSGAEGLTALAVAERIRAATTG